MSEIKKNGLGNDKKLKDNRSSGFLVAAEHDHILTMNVYVSQNMMCYR